MTEPKNVIGQPDHGAPGIWSNRPFRTAVQGAATDVAVAVGLVLYDALENGHADWRLLGLSVIKTAGMTLLSYAMKKMKPAS